jgi:peptidoglycan hydrolase-like protein with peptidoglycan-binding domain
MKKLLPATLAALLALSISAAAQNTNSSANGANTNSSASAPKKKRGPVFRALKDQIKEAQVILKQRSFYSGDATGKLDTATRDGLRKYQMAENLKITGTLNAATLQKMGITLTDKQQAWVAAHSQPTP